MRRGNLLAGVLALAISGVLFARVLGLVSDSLFDLFVRSWPALLVMTGLAVLLAPRVPLGALIGVILSGLLVVGVTVLAYNTRAEQHRSDQQIEINEVVDESIILLRVRMQTLSTDVELVRGPDGANNAITGRFEGSTESDVQIVYLEDADASGTFSVTETQLNPFPELEAVGRGTLLVEVPSELPVDIQLESLEGDVRLNMRGVALERLNVDLGEGDALVTLPSRDPLYSEQQETLGTVAVNNGDLTMRVPEDIAARFELNRGGSGIEPDYDPGIYNFLVGDVLEARDIDDAQIVMRFVLTAPRGQITLNVPEA